MDVNEVLTEEHPFGIEPETYSELETNHPKLYKNIESGTSPVKNPFDDKEPVEIKEFKVRVPNKPNNESNKSIVVKPYINIVPPSFDKVPNIIAGRCNSSRRYGGCYDIIGDTGEIIHQVTSNKVVFNYEKLRMWINEDGFLEISTQEGNRAIFPTKDITWTFLYTD